jgi:putative endonuclease
VRLNGVQEVAGSNPAGPTKSFIVVFQVYILRSHKTGRRYIGSCHDIEQRLQRHNAGHSKTTRHGVPWTLEHSESFATRAEATKRERYFKTGRGRDELDRLQK